MSTRTSDAALEDAPEYRATSALDDLRRTDYARLDAADHVYLDYTGSGLYADSQIRDHAAFLRREVLGNPHSVSLASGTTTTWVEGARAAVLEHFNATRDYTAIFTLNATGALKHVGESYAFAPGSRLLLTFDNHNSVNGIREFAQARGAVVDYAPLTVPDLRIDLPALGARLDRAERARPNLFAYPAQSNFSGVKHPFEPIEDAKARGWDVLLDAAAYVPTNPLDLSVIKPDFVTISFYKMFGYPTGVGCLLVRHEAFSRLKRPWFAGGTVNFATVQGRAHILAPWDAGFEDGTLNFLSIPAVEIGLRHLHHVGIATIHTRVRCLTEWLLARLLALRHSNGRHMVRIYGPVTPDMRGGTITLNCYDPDGHLLDYRRIEERASVERISLRTGCFCNPGAGEAAEGLTEEDMRAAAAVGSGMTLPRLVQFMQTRGGKSAGAMRVSFGVASNARDAERFLAFIHGFRDQSRLAIGEVTFDIESCRVIRDGA